VLATNQGLLYVLAMVVIGGLVGAGALGYDVVYGLAHSEYAGKGIAAGLSIVLLGVMIDRITRSAASRMGAGPSRRAYQLKIFRAPPAALERAEET
jgi:glycine betaine/proline transport system permease protein